MNWKTDGIRGFDKIIRVNGKLYELWTTRCASSFSGLPTALRFARKYAGKSGKVYKVHNTFCYAIYLPYSGNQQPINRSARKND